MKFFFTAAFSLTFTSHLITNKWLSSIFRYCIITQFYWSLNVPKYTIQENLSRIIAPSQIMDTTYNLLGSITSIFRYIHTKLSTLHHNSLINSTVEKNFTQRWAISTTSSHLCPIRGHWSTGSVRLPSK